jgi:hypothetical protein
MSSYSWSARREAERKAAADAEEQRRKAVINETNYPALSNEIKKAPKKGNQYAKLAAAWAVDDEVERQMEQYKKFQVAVDKSDQERIRRHHAQTTRYERHEEDYEEELASEPTASSSVLDDGGGWTEVKRKVRKPKRELTDEEMEQKDKEAEQEDMEEFNGHLFDSNRHDHDRV